jgi:2',3'-cyclic-nucleotide 2'-phosphodiesterase (5'-nucleotidase family)
MRQSISYTLLITWILVLASCQSEVVKTGYKAENISVSNAIIQLDSNIVRLYLPYKEILDEDMNRVISVSTVEMNKDRPESYLTNFLGDLLLAEAAIISVNQGLEATPNVSFFNYGGIRSNLPAGEITVGKIYELMPFENELVFVKLSGKKMKSFLDYIAARGGDSVGGVRFVISDNQADKIKIGTKDFDQQKSYWMVTNDYVAAGGDGLSMLQNSEDYIQSGLKIRDIIITHLEKKQKDGEALSPTLDGRFSYE